MNDCYARQNRGWLRRVVFRITASGPGAKILSRILHHVDPVVFKLTRGRRTLTSLITGLPIVMLTTTGRKSGRPRTLPLLGVWDAEQAGRFALIASNWGQQRNPGWYYNLKAHPLAHCVINGDHGDYRAHEATGEEYDRFWRCAEATYPGFTAYKKRAAGRHIPIMIMTPVPAPERQ